MKELDILLPTLNSENTILKTLESINRAQNKYKNLKVVVLVSDGGSLVNKADLTPSHLLFKQQHGLFDVRH